MSAKLASSAEAGPSRQLAARDPELGIVLQGPGDGKRQEIQPASAEASPPIKAVKAPVLKSEKVKSKRYVYLSSHRMG